MKFAEMQGFGNDYICIDCFSEQIVKSEELAVRIADRHFGAGGDDPILICPSEIASIRMCMFNADDSRGKMCGNDAHCVARYAYDHSLVTSRNFDIETRAGIRHAEVGESLVTIDMGETVLGGELEEATTVDGKVIRMTPVNVGNPYAVYLIDSLEALRGFDPNKIGPTYEHHPRFPKGVNSEFLYIENPTEFHMWVYKRDSGETLTCGTDVTTITFAAVRFGHVNEKVVIHLLGGDPMLEQLSDGYFWMTRPAAEVFSGSYFSE